MNKQKMRKHGKRILCALLSVILTLVPLVSTVGGVILEAAADMPPVVSIQATGSPSQSGGFIELTLMLNVPTTAPVKVYYHTENRSAVAGVDYTAVKSSVTISGSQFAKISVMILSTSPYQLTMDNKNYSREFAVVLDKAENASIGIDNTAICSLSAKHTYSASQSGSYKYLSEYVTVKETSIDENVEDEHTYQHPDLFAGQTGTWYSDYYSTGLANVYVGPSISKFDHPDWQSGGTTLHWYLGNYNYQENGNSSLWNSGVVFGIGVETRYEKSWQVLDGDAIAYLLKGKNPYKQSSKYLDISKKKDSCEDYFNPGYGHIYLHHGSDAKFSSNYYFLVPPYRNQISLNLTVYNGANVRDITHISKLQLVLSDTDAPKMKSVYLDDSLVATDGKLRLSVRYSEPVYTGSKGAVFVAFEKPDGSYLSDVRFEYAGGNNTDTLYYDYAVGTRDLSIKGFKIKTQDTLVRDFAYNTQKSSNPVNNYVTDSFISTEQVLTNPIYFVKPKLSATPEQSNECHTVYEVTVDTEVVGCDLYYVWSQEPDAPKDDINKYFSRSLGNATDTTLMFGDTTTENGKWYLHTIAINKYGSTDFADTKGKATKTFGPFSIDRTAPWVEVTTKTNTIYEKVFEIGSRDLPESGAAGVKKIEILINGTPYVLVEDGVIKDTGHVKLVTTMDGSTVYRYTSVINSEDPSFPTENFDRRILDLMEAAKTPAEKVRQKFRIAFRVTDASIGLASDGNSFTTKEYEYTYDRRNKFPTTIKIGTGLTEIFKAGSDEIKVYDISGLSGVSATITETESIGDAAFFIQDNFGNETEGRVYNGPDGNGLVPGYYELTPLIRGGDPGDEYELVSQTYSFYVTDGKTDPTTNYQKAHGNIVLINEVFQLQNVSYTYLDDANAVKYHNYGASLNEYGTKYVGGSALPSFSSKKAAVSYLTYMERQDLKLLLVTENIADLLNTGTGGTSYTKADGETTIAQPGQYWIRYKRSTWSRNSDNFDWVYYFYSDVGGSSTIQVDKLPNNLNDAISTVVNYIAGFGKTVYLVGPDTSTVTGAPYLYPSQMHVETELCAATHAGSTFEPQLKYAGDSALYQNTVTIGDETYPLATNYTMEPGLYTFIYYKPIDSDTWTDITISTADTLRNIIGGNGLFDILEIDEHGMNEFRVYLDVQAPKLKVNVDGGDKYVDAGVPRYTGTDFSFVLMEGEEYDPYAYVALYSYNGARLKGVYYADDLPGLTPEVGNYSVEVGDRSGNKHTFSLLMSTKKFNEEEIAKENSTGTSLVIRCTTHEYDEISRYEVRCNNESIPVDKTKLVDRGESFSVAGVYFILLQDIYGNTCQATYTFNYKTPEVSWSYQTGSGSFSRYNPENIVSMVEVKNKLIAGYDVYTSVPLRFKLSNELGTPRFEIHDLDKSQYSISKDELTVTVGILCNWSMSVWYEGHEDTTMEYTISVDAQGPSIGATYVGSTYSRNEDTSLNEALVGASNGQVLTPPSIGYRKGDANVRTLKNGDVVSSSCITLNIEDPTGIMNLSIQRNGADYPVNGTGGKIILNSPGLYQITATDRLGNVRTMSFTNSDLSFGTASVDGKDVSDSDGVAYGHTEAAITPLADCETDILVTVGGTKTLYRYDYDQGTIVAGEYRCLIVEENAFLQKYWYVDPVLSTDDKGFSYNAWYVLAQNENYTISIRISDKTEQVTYRVECLKDTVNVEMRAFPENGKKPNYLIAELSKYQSDVPLRADNKVVETNRTGKIIYATGVLSVPEIRDPKVVLVEASYAPDKNFTDFTTVYEAGNDEIKGIKYSGDGFYCVRITNIYGNVTDYEISISKIFNLVVTAKYVDGAENAYNFIVGYDQVIRSNGSITVAAYSDMITFYVNGKLTVSQPVGGVSLLTFDTAGNYQVSMTDAAGNVRLVTLEIGNNTEFEFDENWLTGYNKAALRLADGYTNKKLKVVPNTDKVAMVYLMKDGEVLRVLYDVLAQETVVDEKLLINAIGNDGDGDYVVAFRDFYGDLRTKTIHYRETPTLLLSRVTSFAPLGEQLDIHTVENGVFSNFSMTFATEAQTYRFTVNGDPVSLLSPKVLEFTSSSGDGTIPYEITYVDEYGFTFAFTATLMRKTLVIDTSPMVLTELDSGTYTRGNVSVRFANGLTGFVTYEDEERTPYESGTVLRRDGTYKFLVVDNAGNIRALTVTHDSTVEFSIVDRDTGLAVINGGAINADSLSFRRGEDERSISFLKVFYEGEEIKDFSDNYFDRTGRWELLLRDEVGNTAYFSFTLINHTLKEFSFDAPYGYRISEVWFTDDGENEVQISAGAENSVTLEDEGIYAIILLSETDSETVNFTVTIDRTPPTAELVGCAEGESTPYEVSLAGLSRGDVVTVYRNGELYQVMTVSSVADKPLFTEGGDYVVEVENLAGVVQTLSFTKKHIANTASSILIIFACVAVQVGVFIALLYRTRSKTDD